MHVKLSKSFTKTSVTSKVIRLFQNIFQFIKVFTGVEKAQAYLSKIMQIRFVREKSAKMLFSYKCDDEELHQVEFKNHNSVDRRRKAKRNDVYNKHMP